ncbi:hypothetical protein HII31_10837 [Pseudocercospora fuligena]|uniref:F-box domain-containing protein n=1 Tax=Pseudocercospora fuligena TaxID=685502 RepID=A0A8H6RC98_9PEZI|nr:hypothetical protein HII31_10837 [Pseudocercospora fuligena]
MASNNGSSDKFTSLPLEMLQHIAGHLSLWDRLKLRTVFPKNQEEVVVNLIGDALKMVYVSPNKLSLGNFENIAASGFYQTHIRSIIYVPRVICCGYEGDGFDELGYDSLQAYRDAHPALSRPDAAESFALYQRLLEEYDFDNSVDMDTLENEESEARIRDRLRKGVQKLPNVTEISISTAIESEGLNASCLAHSRAFDKYQNIRGSNNCRRDVSTIQACNSLLPWHFQAFIWVMLDVLDAAANLRRFTIGKGAKSGLDLDHQFSCAYRTNNFKKALANLTHLTLSIAYTTDFFATRSDHSRFIAMAKNATALQELTLYLDATPDDFDEWRKEQKRPRIDRAFLQVGGFRQLKVLRITAEEYYQDVDINLFEQFLFRHRHVLQQVYLRNVLLAEKCSGEDEKGYNEKWDECVCQIIRRTLPEIGAWMRELRTFEMKLKEHEPPHHMGERDECFICKEQARLAEELDVPSEDDECDFGVIVMRSKAKYNSEIRVGDQN